MAGGLRTDRGTHVRFAGPTFVRLDDPVSFRGYWENHPKYGRQFTVKSLEPTVALDPAGLASFLANHPEIHGIGPIKAQRIATEFAADFDRVIRADPAAIARVAKISMHATLNLQTVWNKTADLNATMSHLSGYGLTHFQVASLVGKFGNQVVPMLKQDPYILRGELPGFGFRKIDKIARQMGAPKSLPSRLQAGLLHAVDEALDGGDCWVDREKLIERADTLLVLDDLDSRSLIERQLHNLMEKGTLVSRSVKPVIIALPEIEAMETFLACVFRQANCPNPHGSLLSDMALTELGAEQQLAVENSSRYSISLITGGAGSGKTFTIDAIVRAHEGAGLRCVLAAPTGKAARRMEQATGRCAQTIHHLLGFNGHSFGKGRDDKIDADLLVIDELSMVDVRLAYHLFQAINLARTAVLLVGDHNQLPPVGPGNVLRDLVVSGAVPTVVLNQIFRQAGALKQNSAAILNGIVAPTAERRPAGVAPWYVISSREDRPGIRKMLEQMFRDGLTEKLGFDLIRDVQVLTPVHDGPLGTAELNSMLQRVIHEKLFGTTLPEGNDSIRVGDKVIQTRNDYRLEVMNGSIGFVRDIDPDRFVVEFDAREVEIPTKIARRDLRLAYATSIHKMQGSEFPCAIVIVHKSHKFMHHRNLLYTAVTRAQKTALIIGDAWGIQNCVREERASQRNTFLSLLLREGNGRVERIQ
jgi:exodeoxyribonuclease V alpha subunit